MQLRVETEPLRDTLEALVRAHKACVARRSENACADLARRIEAAVASPGESRIYSLGPGAVIVFAPVELDMLAFEAAGLRLL